MRDFAQPIASVRHPLDANPVEREPGVQMFRITSSDRVGTHLLRLEGALTATEIPLLEASLVQANGVELVLDLSGVRWIDVHAASRLHALRAEGVALIACSPFLERLLGDDRR